MLEFVDEFHSNLNTQCSVVLTIHSQQIGCVCVSLLFQFSFVFVHFDRSVCLLSIWEFLPCRLAIRMIKLKTNWIKNKRKVSSTKEIQLIVLGCWRRRWQRWWRRQRNGKPAMPTDDGNPSMPGICSHSEFILHFEHQIELKYFFFSDYWLVRHMRGVHKRIFLMSIANHSWIETWIAIRSEPFNVVAFDNWFLWFRSYKIVRPFPIASVGFVLERKHIFFIVFFFI